MFHQKHASLPRVARGLLCLGALALPVHFAAACGDDSIDGAGASVARVAIEEGTGGTGLELGVWKFNDCSTNSNVVVDSSGNGLHGIMTAGVGCAPGVDGLGIKLDAGGERVTVAHSSAFTFAQNLTVLAFVNPTAVGNQEQIIAQKSDGRRETFTLKLVNGKVEFSVELQSGVRVRSSAPLTPGVWSNVAGSYNGTSLFLFIEGQQVGQVAAAGSLRNVTGPLVFGGPNKGRSSQLLGSIDEVRLINQPVQPFDILDRSCIRRPMTLAVVASQSGPVAPETAIDYDVAVTNGNCFPSDFFFATEQVPGGFSVSGDFSFQGQIARGATAHFPITVVGSADAEPGLHEIFFNVFDFSFGGQVRGALPYQLTEPTGCNVKTSRELLIRNSSVVDDPIRTSGGGAWTFGQLMRDMAPTPELAPAMVENLFNRWLSDQTMNGFTMPARQSMQFVVLDQWPRTANGELDLDRSPLRLLAIVNRMDLRNLDQGNAGEGRFVFGVAPDAFGPLQFTVILEYRLPAQTEADVVAWTQRWHGLGSLPFPSEEYNAALQAVTDQFAGPNAEPGRVNDNAISQVRTNEIALAGPWELREFTLSAATGFLAPATVKLTPDFASFDGTQTLANFLNQNEAAVLLERHDVPEIFEGVPFLTGNSLNDLIPWSAPGINNNNARHKFSMNTCNGCHGPETGTGFLHVFPRNPGQESQLSGFMTGTTVFDPISGEARTLNDLGRRRTDLFSLVCQDPGPVPPTGEGEGEGEGEVAPAAATTTTNGNLRRGISRTH